MMSREIKFRGISTETGKWVYGHLIIDKQEAFILNGVIESTNEYIAIEDWRPVKAETVGQFIGLLDVNDVELYENDVLEHPNGDRFVIKWSNSNCAFRGFYGSDDFGCCIPLQINNKGQAVFIGNIYENPELLKPLPSPPKDK